MAQEMRGKKWSDLNVWKVNAKDEGAAVMNSMSIFLFFMS